MVTRLSCRPSSRPRPGSQRISPRGHATRSTAASKDVSPAPRPRVSQRSHLRIRPSVWELRVFLGGSTYRSNRANSPLNCVCVGGWGGGWGSTTDRDPPGVGVGLTRRGPPSNIDPPFVEATRKFAFGDDAAVIRDGRVATLQSLSGTGALRLAADALAQVILYSNPRPLPLPLRPSPTPGPNQVRRNCHHPTVSRVALLSRFRPRFLTHACCPLLLLLLLLFLPCCMPGCGGQVGVAVHPVMGESRQDIRGRRPRHPQLPLPRSALWHQPRF